MAGFGGYWAMAQSIKYNKGLIKNRSYYNLRDEYRAIGKNKKLNFRMATPEQLLVIRYTIKQRRKREFWFKLLALTISAAILLVAYWFIAPILIDLFEADHYPLKREF